MDCTFYEGVNLFKPINKRYEIFPPRIPLQLTSEHSICKGHFHKAGIIGRSSNPLIDWG